MVGMKPLLNIISWNLSSDGDGSFKMFILKSPRIYTFLPFSFERIRSYASLNSSSDAFGGRYITPTTVGLSHLPTPVFCLATVWRTDLIAAPCVSALPKPVLVSKIRVIARDSTLPPLRLALQRCPRRHARTSGSLSRLVARPGLLWTRLDRRTEHCALPLRR